MSEFKITPIGTGQYISEWNGNSANDGTAANPKKHPNEVPASTANVNIIGPGVYKGLISGIKPLKADGKVIIDMLGNTFNPGNFGTVRLFDGCWVKNFTPASTYWHAIDCILEWQGTFLPLLNTGIGSLRNIYLPGVAVGGINGVIGNSIVMRQITNQLNGFIYNYIPKETTMTFFNSTAYQHNMVNGPINIGGTLYECKRLIDGTTRPDADPLLPDVIAAYPNFYVNGNYSGDPKFISFLDKIVEPSSDLLRKLNGNGFVGGVKPGKFIGKTTSGPDVEITTSQINTSDPSNWSIQAGNDEGFIYLTFKLSDNLVQVPIIHADSIFAFDGSQAGGSSSNNNVPDFFPTIYSPLSQAGLKPNRLTYGLRTSIQTIKPTSESQWDNDALSLSTDVGRYYVQEWGAQPQICNISGVTYGAGSPQFPTATVKNTINARWCQIQIRLTNKRTY